MFTGIVQSKAAVSFIEHLPGFTRYAISFANTYLNDLKIGASVSIDGACQTVVAIQGTDVYFEAIAQTLLCTKISTLKVGSFVNIERSMKIGDEIGGHLLSGHVIGTAKISNIIANHQGEHILTFACPPKWIKYIFHKGYIAINGVSLTVQTVTSSDFSVHLIPETLRITTFDKAQEGDLVNIEIDSQTQTIVDTVERVLAAKSLA